MKANDPVYRIVAKSHYENTNTYNMEAQKAVRLRLSQYLFCMKLSEMITLM